jgi:tRNA pseudouridine55 synthase
MLNGIIVVDKPAGMTSQAVVSRVKRALGVKKVGHAGTLDPMATGVLIVGVGRATRMLGFLAGHDKRYLATIRLGVATTTDDAEGERLAVPVDAAHLDEAQVRAAMVPLTGEISQVPSAVSAIKVDGKRAYALVRAGEQVELKARSVTVSAFDLTDLRAVAFADGSGSFLDLDVAVECSSGTYIRALARDLGHALGVGAHLTSLRRTRVGAFDVAEAVPLEGVSADRLMSMGAAAQRSFSWAQVDESTARQIHFGRPVAIDLHADPTALLAASGELLALYRPGHPAKPVAVFVS